MFSFATVRVFYFVHKTLPIYEQKNFTLINQQLVDDVNIMYYVILITYILF